VDFHGRAIPPLKRLELEQDLVNTLNSGDVESVIARSRKQLPKPAEVRVRFDSQVAENHTVVQIEADDQPALLYRITRAMAALGWDIHSARISTLGDRARDAFYVTTREGGKLEGDESTLLDQFLHGFTADLPNAEPAKPVMS
jgi:[protein-PII] uridylyltransferase